MTNDLTFGCFRQRSAVSVKHVYASALCWQMLLTESQSDYLTHFSSQGRLSINETTEGVTLARAVTTEKLRMLWASGPL